SQLNYRPAALCFDRRTNLGEKYDGYRSCTHRGQDRPSEPSKRNPWSPDAVVGHRFHGRPRWSGYEGDLSEKVEIRQRSESLALASLPDQSRKEDPASLTLSVFPWNHHTIRQDATPKPASEFFANHGLKPSFA